MVWNGWAIKRLVGLGAYEGRHWRTRGKEGRTASFVRRLGKKDQ
jgi:hypothetical protein